MHKGGQITSGVTVAAFGLQQHSLQDKERAFAMSGHTASWECIRSSLDPATRSSVWLQPTQGIRCVQANNATISYRCWRPLACAHTSLRVPLRAISD